MYRGPGSTMPCSITRVGVAPASQNRRVEVGDVDQRQVVAVGRRVAHLGDPPLGRVVLDVDGGHVAPGPAAASHSLGQSPPRAGAAAPRRRIGSSASCLAAAPRAPRPASPRSAPGRARPGRGPGSTGTQVLVRPWTNAVVHAPCTCQSRILMPPPPPARAGAAASTRRRAPRRRPTSVEARVAGHRAGSRARQPAHGTSPSSTRAAPATAASARPGRPGANSETTGVPTAAARCAGPVLPTTTAAAPASTAASSARSSGRRGRRAGRGGPATRAVSARSPAPPVTTTRRPAAPSASTSARAALGRPGAGRAPTRPGAPRRSRARSRRRRGRGGHARAARRRRRRAARSRPPRDQGQRALDLVHVVGDRGGGRRAASPGSPRDVARDARHAGQPQQQRQRAAGSGGTRSRTTARSSAQRARAASTSARDVGRVDRVAAPGRSTARSDHDLVDAGQQRRRLGARAGRTAA